MSFEGVIGERLRTISADSRSEVSKTTVALFESLVVPVPFSYIAALFPSFGSVGAWSLT
jgi:hypothetical protein